MSSVMRSSVQPSASAIIAIDSVSPTCRTLPSSTFFWNCSVVRPAPIFCWNGSRRMRASCTRLTTMRSTRSQTAVSAIGSASIAKPGLTPVPSTADLRLLRHRVNLPRLRGCACSRDTTAPRSSRRSAVFALRIVSICGMHLLDRRARAQHDDVGLRRLQRLGRVGRHLDAEALRQADDVAEIAADLRRIDVDGADDLESGPRRHLFDDGGADRAEPEVHHADMRA